MEIKSLELLTNCSGPDILNIRVNMIEGIYPFKNLAVMKLEIAKGRGEDYVRSNFDMGCRVVNLKTGDITYIGESPES